MGGGVLECPSSAWSSDWAWVCGAQEPGLSVLMVSHDRSFIDAVCDEVLELDGAGGAYRHQARPLPDERPRRAETRAFES